MARAIFVRMNKVSLAIAVTAFGACTQGGKPEPELPDSALLEVPADPAGAPQPVRTDSLTRGPVQAPSAPAAAPTTPTTRTPDRNDPPITQPPPPRDTRPSIPWPPDTL